MKSKIKSFHYTYYSYEEWGRGYIGSRTCTCLPEEDIKYFGSFKDKSFKPTQKIILKSDYATREEAYDDEIILHRYFKVVENPHFANKANQTSTGFSRKGLSLSEEQKAALREKFKGKNSGKNNPMYGKRGPKNPMYGKRGKNNPNYGKRRTQESKNKISKALTGRKLSESHLKNLRITKNRPDQKEKMRQIALSWKRTPLSDDHKRKLSESLRGKNSGELNGNFGKTWYTNGDTNIMGFESPPGFWKGYTQKRRKTWKITFLNGEYLILDNLSEWCKENGYNISNVINVKRGRIKIHKNIIRVETVDN
jgi:hypothetical protein